MDQDTRDSIDRLDKKLDSYTQATNDKLDILIDLTKQMAIMHQKQIQQGDELLRIEKLILQSRDDFRISMERTDRRVTTVDLEKRASIERLHKRVDELSVAHDAKDSAAKHEVMVEVKELETAVKVNKESLDAFKDTYSEKVSFMRGAMWVLGIVMVIAQGLAVKYVADIQTNIESNQKAIVQMNNRFNETDKQLDIILNSMKVLRK